MYRDYIKEYKENALFSGFDPYNGFLAKRFIKKDVQNYD